MSIGTQKRQWFLILLALSAPLLLNIIALWQDIGTDSILKIWNGTYPQPLLGFLGSVYNPLPEIFLKLLLFLFALGFLAWFVVFITSKEFFQKQSQMVKLFEIGIMALVTAVVFDIVSSFMMPLIWLPKFHDYLLGLPSSPFMINWSRWFIFPATAIILFIASLLSGDKNLEKKK
jgi:hypothetical protein